ncbi:Reticulon-4-interacting protein 1, mitochondrial [Morella rubra]|uniref:Reticulon-4-interacting protein 1, mitochondrial n=1 Tax=Morella rubra TaxID=262757 RepID=A0A6A1VXE7_9ROSI|nr:Reticulon-4-interacting protein 1, mitochondrial [Morella rubra]
MRILRFRSFRMNRNFISSNSAVLGLRGIVTSCRAVVLQRFGGPEVLELRPNVEVPDLKSNEVLVRARAVSINPLDTRMRLGYGRSIFDHIYLSYWAAILVEASAIPFAALTAWRALKSTARITEGQRLLVVGGGGAVGFTAIQLAVAAGCHVTTTCGSQSVGRMLAAGAEQAVDYTAEDIELAIKGKFDAVLDTIGGPETERISINFLKRAGHYMTLQGEAASLADKYGLAAGLPLATALLLKKQIQYRYSHGIEYWWTYMRADSEGLHEIRKLSEAGKLKVPVEKTFPITQVREAHEAKDRRHVPGKVVLEID